MPNFDSGRPSAAAEPWNANHNAERIRRQMGEVRADLGDAAEEAVLHAKRLTDWRYYVKAFPWACLAGAVTIGYLAVPNRRDILTPDVDDLAELARRNQLVVQRRPKPTKSVSAANAALSLLANVLMRGAAHYIRQRMAERGDGTR